MPDSFIFSTMCLFEFLLVIVTLSSVSSHFYLRIMSQSGYVVVGVMQMKSRIFCSTQTVIQLWMVFCILISIFLLYKLINVILLSVALDSFIF